MKKYLIMREIQSSQRESYYHQHVFKPPAAKKIAIEEIDLTFGNFSSINKSVLESSDDQLNQPLRCTPSRKLGVFFSSTICQRL